jgi:hypothetical protein
MYPTPDPFTITMDHLPHGFAVASTEHVDWFEHTINSDIRYYYRMIRKHRNITDHNPIGRSGITAGELALYIIRENHTKRQKRY